MNFLSVAGPGVATGEMLIGAALGIVRILAFAAVGAVFVGAVMACLCELFEGRKWRRCHGRTEFWALMH